MGRAFWTAKLDSGDVKLSGIEVSPGNKQVVQVPCDRATELHHNHHSEGKACTAETCSMAALTEMVAKRK